MSGPLGILVGDGLSWAPQHASLDRGAIVPCHSVSTGYHWVSRHILVDPTPWDSQYPLPDGESTELSWRGLPCTIFLDREKSNSLDTCPRIARAPDSIFIPCLGFLARDGGKSVLGGSGLLCYLPSVNQHPTSSAALCAQRNREGLAIPCLPCQHNTKLCGLRGSLGSSGLEGERRVVPFEVHPCPFLLCCWQTFSAHWEKFLYS